ncbi:metallophosphoesterase [Microbacterium sp. P07]|uniref:metallophosphoesterase n=1 Tax=Microbacterium sp. P07 TaxID=3366952 RepID=UPI00374512A5
MSSRSAGNWRRRIASLAGIGLLASTIAVSGPAIAHAAATDPVEDGKFTFAVIPDTQGEVLPINTSKNLFPGRTQWLVDNKAALDLRFVAHTGDVINGDPDDHSYIKVASDAMKKLDDAGIPSALALGGVDSGAVAPGGAAKPGVDVSVGLRDTSNFSSFFPESRFPGVVTYQSEKIENNYQVFSAEGKDWLVLTLEVWPRTEVVDWAKTVVEAHPNHNVIVNTHEFLSSNGTISTSKSYGANAPSFVWDNLVKLYPNIKFVVSGNGGGTANSTTLTGEQGNKIGAVRANFGSAGVNAVELIEINTIDNTASTRYYSPANNQAWPELATTFSDMAFVAGTAANPAAVVEAIDALPATVTLADKAAVRAARGLYNSLTDADKTRVGNLAKLTAAEATIAELTDEATFSIAVLPDTQQEVVVTSAITNKHFKQRTQWLADNADDLDMRFVLHTGDVVNWDTPDHDQYEIADEAMKVIDDAGIPSLLTIGNHDTAAVGPGGSAADPTNTRALVRDTTTFNSYFPVSRYPGVQTFEPNKIDNAYRTFEAGGKKWLVLSLELWPRTEAVEWAKTVVESHADYNVIVSTHSYLDGDNGGIYQNSDYGQNSPQYVFDNLVKLYPNIKLVFSGHTGLTGSRVDTGVNGNKIVSILGTIHSSNTNPVQLVEINAAEGTVSSEFYVPITDQAYSVERNFDNLGFVDPNPADTDDQQISVTVKADAEPGEFVWSIDGTNGLVDLGTAEREGDHYQATGEINPIRVTDTRVPGATWAISAQVGDFKADDQSFSGKYLGWTPKLLAAGGGATAGASVASGFTGGDGLSVSSTLGTAAIGHELGSALLGADLDLKLPVDVAEGTYLATLTLTALS